MLKAIANAMTKIFRMKCPECKAEIVIKPKVYKLIGSDAVFETLCCTKCKWNERIG